jgi:tRNA1Val (adenine37-N6)-methyltransferase
MPNNEFTFKKFRVNQDRNVMRVGTDAVILGSWTNPGNAERILDVGTGTGLLALMMAQRSEAEVHAVDIEEEAFEQARENFILSPWNERLIAHHLSLQHYSVICQDRYDLVISNPPYFLHAHKGHSETRNLARHLDRGLNIPDLCNCVRSLLKPEGRFCVIFPPKEAVKFMEYAETHGLYVNRLTRVKTKPGKEVKRMLMELEMERKEMQVDELIICDQDMNFTEKYLKLTADFYLNS